jgi:photosystem II stability/assembly factor-like uncharacterized protein
MKNLLLVSFLIIGGIVNAQWVQQHSDAYQYYNSMFFVDSLLGFVSGSPYPGNPFVLKTMDGGENWTQSDISGMPSSLSFTDNNIGFCTTFDGIYKTIDSGDSWNLNYQDENHFSSVKFINENLGWVLGYTAVSNEIYQYKTIDGGLNWNKTFIATVSSDPKIEMINELTGFIISESKIFKTTTGGDNWNVVFDDSVHGHSFWDISFSDELNGFAGGVGCISTSDGGTTWNKIFIPLLFCTNIRTLENNCWATGFGIGYNAIIYSDDFGDTWTPILESANSDIHDVFFSDINNGWYCYTTGNAPPFYNGYICKTESGWLSQITEPSTPQPIYPANNANFEQTTVNFEWEKLNYSLTRFQVSADSLFNRFYNLVNPGNGDTTFFGNNLYIENIKSVAFPYDQKYYWRVRSENLKGVSDWSETWSFTTSSPTNVEEIISPIRFSLSQNYPNPFNPSTKISWQSPVSGWQTLQVYDILGNEVATLVDEYRNAGSYEINFNANALSSGIYFYTFKSKNFIKTGKMVLIR